jgi:hypothetical protein
MEGLEDFSEMSVDELVKFTESSKNVTATENDSGKFEFSESVTEY